MVESYTYLGVHLNNRLDWTDNKNALYEKGSIVKRAPFSDSVAAPAIFYGVVCWGSSISTDCRRLNRLIKKASSDLGRPLDPVEAVGQKRIMAKLSSLMENVSHHMQDTLTALAAPSVRGRFTCCV